MATLHQLAHDARDELLPRQLAAALLYAEIAARYPGASGERYCRERMSLRA
jgi:hypothetical protein